MAREKKNKMETAASGRERSFPQAPEAEQSVLGAMLMESQAINAAIGVLEEKDFYYEKHRKIYAAMRDMHMAQKSCNFITVGEELRARGQIEEVGNFAYLQHLHEQCPTAATILEYSKFVKDASLDRQRITLLSNGLSAAWDNPRAALEKTVSAIEDLKSRESIGRNRKGVSARDLMKMVLPSPKWAVEGIISEGLTILAGKPKMGKSWLTLSVALAAAMGGHALGSIPVQQGPVLYLGLEDGLQRMQSRLQVLLHGQEAPESLEFHFEWPRLNEGGLEQIEAWLKANRSARLVVVDTLEKARPKREKNGNTYGEDYAALAPLQRMALKYGVAVVMVHHTTKMTYDDFQDEVSGSAALTGAADSTLVLKRKRNSNEGVLYRTGRDIVSESELALKFDVNVGAWTLVGEASAVKLSNEREAILEVLIKADGPLAPRDIAEIFGRDSRDSGSIRKMLFEMFHAGQVQKEGDRYLISSNGRRDYEAQNPNNSSNAGNAVTPVTQSEYSEPAYPQSYAQEIPISHAYNDAYVQETPKNVHEIRGNGGNAVTVTLEETEVSSTQTPLIDHPKRLNTSEHYVAPAWLKRDDVPASTQNTVTALPALPRYRTVHDFHNFLREFGFDVATSPPERVKEVGQFLDWWGSKYTLRPSKGDIEENTPQFVSETAPVLGGDVPDVHST